MTPPGTLLRGHDGIIEMIEAQRLATVPLDTGSAVDAGPTQLRVTDGRALVWASEGVCKPARLTRVRAPASACFDTCVPHADAMTLRTKHRITGSALGHPTGTFTAQSTGRRCPSAAEQSGWLAGPKHTEPYPSLPLLLTLEETLLICENGVKPYITCPFYTAV